MDDTLKIYVSFVNNVLYNNSDTDDCCILLMILCPLVAILFNLFNTV